MGKSQYKKKIRHNPIRIPGTHLGSGKVDGKANPAKEQQMLPILGKLKSAHYADRTWACAAICNLIQDDPATRRLFQGRNVVGELIERLSDSVDEVAVEASGALRNLAIDGGHELCGEMYNKGIMSHLTTLITKISGTIDSILTPAQTPQTHSDEQLQARKHLLAFAENVISLIWSLAEASEKTLQGVNAAGVEGLLVKVLEGREVFGTGVALAASQALYSLSQDNEPFREALLAQPTALPTLKNIVREVHDTGTANGKGKAPKSNGGEAEEEIGRAALIRLLTSGVLRNLVDDESPADSSVHITALTKDCILPLINDVIDVDLQNTTKSVLGSMQQGPDGDVSADLGKLSKTDHLTTVDQELERVERRLSTVVVALEILTGICAGLEDVEESFGEKDAGLADEDEDMEDDLQPEANDDDAAPDASRTVDGANGVLTVLTPVDLPHLLIDLKLPQRLLNLALFTTLSFAPSPMQPSSHPPTTAILSVLHLRALETLNNLFLTTVASLTPTASMTSAFPAQTIWDGLLRIVSQLVQEMIEMQMNDLERKPRKIVISAVMGRAEKAEMDVEGVGLKGQELKGDVLEMAMGCLWGLVKIASAASSQLAVQPEQMQAIMETTGVVRSDLVRTRCIETMASLASRPGVPIEQNREIGERFISMLSPPPGIFLPPDLLVSVLNAVIDIYADEGRGYDRPVFVDGGFLQALTPVVEVVRANVRQINKRTEPALRAQAAEAYRNLIAFIQYRRNLRLWSPNVDGTL